MLIYITRQLPEIGLKMLKENGFDIDQNPDDRCLTKEEIIGAISKKPYDAVISFLTDKIDSDVFDACPSAKIFANYAVGFNNIDLEEAKKRGVTITNTPGNLTDSVAEHSVALLLAVSNKILQSDNFLRKGNWTGFDPDLFLRDDLSEKVIGIIGAGRIGYRFGYILNKGFGSKIIYSDIKRNEIFENDLNAEFKENMDDVLKNSDVISLNVPLMDKTRHLINENRFRMMKKNAIFINTSRGAIVDESSMVKILKEGVIAGAGLDVFEFEPNLVDGLKDLPNVVLTPHIASATYKARDEMAKIACKNVIDFLSLKEPENRVA